jgi:hypothetical protein
MQSVPITTSVVSSIPAHADVYWYNWKRMSVTCDMSVVFLRVLRLLPPKVALVWLLSVHVALFKTSWFWTKFTCLTQSIFKLLFWIPKNNKNDLADICSTCCCRLLISNISKQSILLITQSVFRYDNLRLSNRFRNSIVAIMNLLIRIISQYYNRHVSYMFMFPLNEFGYDRYQ